MAQELQVDSFERGFTDDYVGGPKNAGQKFDNLLISRERKPFSRPGSQVHLGVNGEIPAGNQRINSTANFNNELVVFSGDQVFQDDGTSYSEILGNTVFSGSQSAFNNLTTADTNQISTAQWQDHLFVAQNDQAQAKVRTRTYSINTSDDYVSNDAGTLKFKIVLHGFSDGDIIQFTNVGGLPGGIVAATNYYIVQSTRDTFKVSTTSGGSAVAYSSSGVTFTITNNKTYTKEARNFPVKIYENQTGVKTLVTAGLPDPKYVGNVEKLVANITSFKTAIATHVTSSRHEPGVQAVQISYPNPTADDIDSLFLVLNEIRIKMYEHFADANISPDPYFHRATGGSNASLDFLEDVFTIDEAVSLFNDIKAKYDLHRLDSAAHNGLSPTGNVSPAKMDQIYLTTSTGTGAGFSYLYAQVYKREYLIGNTQYIDRSPPHYATYSFTTETNATNTRNMSAKALPDNGLGYDKQMWGSYTIEIYRTTGNGTVLQRCKEISTISYGSGNVSFVDNVPDADLGIPLYTTGGVVEAGMPPRCKYTVNTNDVEWYANCQIDGVVYESKILHSIPLDPDGVPSSFFIDVDGKITGIGQVAINPIVFTHDKVFRLEGTVDSLGRGFVKKRIIDDTTGCISHNSIVTVKDGLYFAGNDGFYFCDGFKCVKISDHLNQSYRNILSRGAQAKLNIYGAYDQKKDLIYWATATRDLDSEENENVDIWCHDRYWGIPNSQGTFTTWSNGDSMRPTALTVIDGDLYRADLRGYVFKHDDDYTEDPIVDTGTTPDNWRTRTVLFDYISCAYSFGSKYQRKWVTKLLTILKSNTSTTIQPYSINDDTANRKPIKLIKNSGDFIWGDPLFVWGSSSFVWRFDPTSFVMRWFPKNGLRCTLKQVEYAAGRAVKGSSDSDGSVSANTGTKVITLAAGTWTAIPDEQVFVGGYIFFGNDPSAPISSGFEILSATTTTLTVSDLTNQLTAGPFTTWLIVAYDRSDRFHLDGYSILYDFFGSSHTGYNLGDAGENTG